MKKMWFLLLLMITVMLTGCCLKHEWVDATCITPKMCSKCEKEEGSPLGHDWEDATCESPKTCATCGKEKGDALGHDWAEATCQEPETCTRCNETQGEALEHVLTQWEETSSTKMAAPCDLCGEEVEQDIDREIIGFRKLLGKWTLIGVQPGGVDGEWQFLEDTSIWVEFFDDYHMEYDIEGTDEGIYEFMEYSAEYGSYWFYVEFSDGYCRIRLDEDGELYWVADKLWLCFEYYE